MEILLEPTSWLRQNSLFIIARNDNLGVHGINSGISHLSVKRKEMSQPITNDLRFPSHGLTLSARALQNSIKRLKKCNSLVRRVPQETKSA
jgi:hypothetical protein